MELSDLDPLPVQDENDEVEKGGDNDSIRADDGGEDRTFDGASSYTSGSSDSDVYLFQAASEGNLVQVKRFINEIKKGENFFFNVTRLKELKSETEKRQWKLCQFQGALAQWYSQRTTMSFNDLLSVIQTVGNCDCSRS